MFSQTTEYALRAMSCLAFSPDGLISTPELAKQTKVPPNYLAKVLQILASAGLIKGRRGVGGGYRLAKPPAEITMLEVINTVSPVERIGSCPLSLETHRGGLCALHRRLDQAAATIIDIFGGVTFEDIVRGSAGEHRPLCETGQLTPAQEMPTLNGHSMVSPAAGPGND